MLSIIMIGIIMFINREKELHSLDEEYHRKSAAFSVVYGRRRVGKTALLGEFIKEKPHIYLYITQSDLRLQLEQFTEQIKAFVDSSIADFINFETFEEAIGFLPSLSLKQRLVLIIDEYQYLAALDKAFSSKLQKLWDEKLQQSNIHLILCGSILSMMQSEVLNYSAPLYGRRTSQIHLKAMKFKYIGSFLPSLSKLEQMQVFASFGTIPKYLLEYDETISFQDNLARKILNKNAYLYSEGNFLLKNEIGDAATYFTILESISKGNTKIGSIASSLSVASTHLTKYLKKLIELDIVYKETPVTDTNPLKSKYGRYRIKDKFLNFWFYYVFKNYNYLEIEQIDMVLKEIDMNFNDRFVSFAFEEFVIEDIWEHPNKYLDFTPLRVGRWWNNKEEIDIVAFDEEHIAFIECKWQNRVDTEKIRTQLIQKASIVKHNKEASFSVVTKEDYLSS